MSRSGLSVRAAPIRTLLAGVAVSAFACAATLAQAADKLIEVQWSDPEIKSFVAANATPRSLGPTADDKLSKLKLPVLAFDATPGVVENTFRLGPRPATERDVVMDEENPVWYQIVENYGDVTVSVSGDLRVQHTFAPDKFPVYENTARGAAPQSGPTVSVFDDRDQGGEEGYLAEYTITKYGVPYTVTVECTEQAKDECRDTTQISKDSDLLKLIRATPPAP
ncbi:hypothetical protein [Hyphomicrobium sp.]|uniref:hypothetical protein n=1 Tax=Hyphomicrobium sp. TaxID=82 RepID=UPI0025C0C844|nr:hypothetical protein [Hyphomicrobium sp.]MCC7252977.1 hypothetical protein [Hyphomicrobium sp.]